LTGAARTQSGVAAMQQNGADFIWWFSKKAGNLPWRNLHLL
jgi:hypothetical protein